MAKPTARATWMSSLIGSVAGIAVWFYGLPRLMWPAHPFWAALLFTAALTVLLQYAWDEILPNPTRRLP